MPLLCAHEAIRYPCKHWVESLFMLSDWAPKNGPECGTLKWDTAPRRYLADGERLAGAAEAG